MKQVMLQILPLVLHIVVGREIPASEHFSRSVDVTVVEGDGGEVQLVAGPLLINLGRTAGNDLLSTVLAQEVSSSFPVPAPFCPPCLRSWKKPKSFLAVPFMPAGWRTNLSARLTLSLMEIR